MAERVQAGGDTSFFGQIGVLADDGERAQCHICGEYFGNLGGHVSQVHGISPRDYKTRFGLKAKTGLLGPALRALHSEQARARRQTAGFARFQEAGRRAQQAIPPEVRSGWTRGRQVSPELRRDPRMRAVRRANLEKANRALQRRIAEGKHQPHGWTREEALRAAAKARARLAELRQDPAWRETFARRISEARGGKLQVTCQICGTTFVEPYSHRRRRTCGPVCLATLRRRMADEARAAAEADRRRRRAAGEAIRPHRLAHGLSLGRLARLAGVSPAHLSRMEQGLNIPSDQALARVQAVLAALDAGEPAPPASETASPPISSPEQRASRAA